MSATAVAPALSDTQLSELLAQLRGADSAELKLTVPDDQTRSAVSAFGLDPLNAQLRMVYFFDTPDLALDRAGMVVRARRVQGKGDDTVVKLRPVVPAELPMSLRESPGFVVEVDAMPGKFVCSGTLKAVPKRCDVATAVRGERPLRRLFSKEQREFYRAHAPEGLELDALSVLGPVFVLKLKGIPEGYERKLVCELWFFPDGTRVLELSTKCPPSEAFDVAAQTRAYLAERGITRSGVQQTKTRKALRFFAKAV
jgi:hypothetical protein